VQRRGKEFSVASIRKKGKRWYLRRYVGGRQVEEALGTSSKRKAAEILRTYEAERTLGFHRPARSRTPLAEFLKGFLRHLELTLGAGKSVANDASRIRCFFREVKIDWLEALTPAVIQHVLELKRSRDSISPKTYNNYREILHRMFEYALNIRDFVSSDPSRRNPVEAVKKCPEHASKISFLTLEEIDELLVHLSPDTRLQAAVATLIYTGLRRSEMLWLTPDDLDLASRLVIVRGKTVNGESWEPKTRKNRSVPVSTSLLAYVEPWHLARPMSAWLFPASQDGRWNPDNFSTALREAQAGLAKRWSCLDFRHTFASHLAKKGVSIFKIAKLLGNSVVICERHYAHLSPAGLADEVEFHTERPRRAPLDRPDGVARRSARRGDERTGRSEVSRPSAVV
jgi:integrase